ncbi:hypothetical protein [Aquibacillus rhizosphaerae]|uniref:Lipoprotein n=1 Tax=Aquibacillus rhizosphaerae TaxID=3051431 RepID=A0ABT7L096_9BACI|nr:hypothetical protein [Aquibacillus sp. LR5S19]MDL4839198.1 hypothetical protein [Aquibacillus sp. LR5S19]
MFRNCLTLLGVWTLLLLVACGSSIETNEAELRSNTDKSSIETDEADLRSNTDKSSTETNEAEIRSNTDKSSIETDEAELKSNTDKSKDTPPKITRQELVELTDHLDEVHREVVDTIETNGWYESMDEIIPSESQFEKEVRPIVTPFFTDAFVTNTIIENMEAFFCYCDAPGPLQGTMKPDLSAEIEQSDDRVQFHAYRPANEINSGSKVMVTALWEQNQWKINSFENVFSSHEQSFKLSLEQIIEYYKTKDVEISHVDTKEIATEDVVYIFETKKSKELIAVHSRDWFTIEGEKQIEQFYP